MRALCLAGSPAAKTRNHNHAHASRRRSAAPGAHCCSAQPRAAREATAPTAQQTMVSLGDLAPPEKPTGRRYLTGRPDGQEAVWRNPRRYLVPKQVEGRAAARQEGPQEPEGRRRDRRGRARAQFPDRAAQSGYDSPERDFVGTHLNRKIIPVPLEETLEHRLGFKGRVRDRRNGIPKVGLKEVVDMWPGYMKQEGLIPGQCGVDNRTPDNVVPKPHKVTPLTYEEKKRRDRLRGEMGDVSGLTNALGEGDDVLASWEERTGRVWKTKAVRARRGGAVGGALGARVPRQPRLRGCASGARGGAGVSCLGAYAAGAREF